MSNEHVAPLRALLREALPQDARLVVGSPDVWVSWAVTLRAQPPAFPDLYGGELALVSMELLRGYDSRITLPEVIARLADAAVSGLAVLGEVSPAALRAAEAQGVALVVLPVGTSLATVERSINTLIANYAAQTTQRALDVQRELTRAAAENHGMQRLVMLLARALGRPVCLHDAVGTLLAYSPGADCDAEVLRAWLDTALPDEAIQPSTLGFTAALRVERQAAGYLSLCTDAGLASLDTFERLVLGYGADVCAMELAKHRAVASAVEQVRGDWVGMWLSGDGSDDDLLADRAVQVGFDPLAAYVVLLVQALDSQGTPLRLAPMLPRARDILARSAPGGAVGGHGEGLVLLHPLTERLTLDRVQTWAQTLRTDLAHGLRDAGLGVGVSREVQGLAALRDAYREARDTLSVAYALGDFQRVTYYGDLKLYRLLMAVGTQDAAPLLSFYTESLRPLVAHDARRGGDLVRTLRGFFAAHGNLARAAVDLDIHRNTLVYRLERISALTGLDLDDPDDRLILHLALKVQRVLSALEHHG